MALQTTAGAIVVGCINASPPTWWPRLPARVTEPGLISVSLSSFVGGGIQNWSVWNAVLLPECAKWAW